MKDKTKFRLIKGDLDKVDKILEDTFEHVVECVSRIDRDGNYLSVNNNFAKVCGYSPEEMGSMSWKLTIHPEDIETAENCYQLMLSEGRAETELRGLRKNGELFYQQIVLVKGIESEELNVSHYCFIKDITSQTLEEKQSLKTIRAEFERYNSLLNNVPGAVYRLNTIDKWQFDFISNAIKDVFRINPDNFNNNGLKFFFKYTHPDDIERLRHTYLLDKNIANTHFSEEYRIVNDRKQTIWVKNTGGCFYNAEGELQHIDGVIIDITRIREVEIEQQNSTEKLIRVEQSTKKLYQITTNHSLSFENKVDQILELCAKFLGVDIGIFGELTEDKYKLIRVFDSSELGLNPGLELTREGSYCNQTASLKKTVALNHVANSDYAKLPGYQQLKLETYLGIPIEINGEIFGTVCFINQLPHAEEFTEVEIEFTQLAAQWIGGEQQKILSEHALNVAKDRQNTLIEIQPECVKQLTRDGNLIYMNPAGLEFIEADSLKQVLGVSVYEVVTEAHHQAFREMNERVFNGETAELEFEIKGLKGTKRWMQTVAKPIYANDGSVMEHFAVTREITEQKENALLIEMERNAYEILTKDISLEKILESLILLAESYSSEMKCSLLFYDKNSHQLKNGVAPSLPRQYLAQIDNIPVAENVGSCGTSAHREERVIVEDIATSPLWKDYKKLALEHGLKACWSTPVHSTQRQLLGTFASYFNESKQPSKFQKQLIFKLIPIISCAIERHHAQKTVAESDERFRMFFEHAPIGKLLLDNKGQIFDLNQSLCDMLNYKHDELQGKSFADLSYAEDRELCVENFMQLFNKNVSEVTFRKRFVDKAGNIKWGNVNLVLIERDNQEESFVIAQVVDVTELVIDELKLHAKTRALKVINDCNHAIRHIDNIEQLLSYTCDVIIDSGKYRFCWVGLAETGSEYNVKPIASAGFEQGYLDNVKITWDNKPTGNGPTGKSIKTQTAIIIRDITSDNNFAPWLKPATERGYRSVVALPLKVNDKLSLVLTIYSGETESFDEEEVKLLFDLANNLTHAIRNIELKKQKLEAEKQLIANEEKYRLLVNDTSAIVWEVDLPEYNFQFVSDAAVNILGYDIEQWYEKDFWPSIIHPDDRDSAISYCIQQTEQCNDHDFEYRMVKKDGSVIWVQDIVNVVLENNRPVKLRGLMIDITDRKEMEQALKISEERFSLAMQGASDGLWDWDLKTDQVYFSPRWKSMLGYKEDEISGELNEFTNLLHPDDVEKTFQLVDDFQHDKAETYNVEFRMRHKDGHYVHILSRGFGVKNEADELIRMVGTHTDVSENTQLAQQLEYQASHDSLTSLVNRTEFENRIKRLIEENSNQYSAHAVCYLDLDNFKIINDTCGHLAGDAMLKQLSELLAASVRGRDTLARLGGDEFGILMEHCTVQQAYSVAEKILKIVEEFRFSWDGNKFAVGVSIGLVPINLDSGNVNDILSAADSACYVAKDSGRNCIYVSYPDDDELEKRKGEMQWVARINQAIEEDMFCLFYQYVVPANYEKNNPAKKRLEILIRLKTHDNAYILPGAFLPAAERYNLSTKIDRWVVINTLNWLKEHEVLQNKIESCAINISGHSLGQKSFLNFCLDIINNSGVAAEKVCFEITETAAISNLNSAINFISKLKNLGCTFALDDFGSGLSSFGYLKNLPVDYVKIDGSFVRDILSDPVDFEMVKVINRLGHIMGKKTIAEFVEDEDIAAMLTAIGVDYLQGYGIAKPKSILEFE